MILNGVIALILRFSPNSIALLADYVTVVEGRPIISVKYCLSVPVFHFRPKLMYPAARSPQRRIHRRRSGWTSGGRMASAEGGSVPSRVWYGEGCPFSSRLRDLGERRELPQRGLGQSPGRNRILACFEVHRTLIFVPI